MELRSSPDVIDVKKEAPRTRLRYALLAALALAVSGATYHLFRPRDREVEQVKEVLPPQCFDHLPDGAALIGQPCFLYLDTAEGTERVTFLFCLNAHEHLVVRLRGERAPEKTLWIDETIACEEHMPAGRAVRKVEKDGEGIRVESKDLNILGVVKGRLRGGEFRRLLHAFAVQRDDRAPHTIRYTLTAFNNVPCFFTKNDMVSVGMTLQGTLAQK